MAVGCSRRAAGKGVAVAASMGVSVTAGARDAIAAVCAGAVVQQGRYRILECLGIEQLQLAEMLRFLGDWS